MSGEWSDYACPIGNHRRTVMNEKTCAACDCPLDESAIQVTIAGKAVEVCCEDCAQKLRETAVTSEGQK
jgi:hypothetical protein